MTRNLPFQDHPRYLRRPSLLVPDSHAWLGPDDQVLADLPLPVVGYLRNGALDADLGRCLERCSPRMRDQELEGEQAYSFTFPASPAIPYGRTEERHYGLSDDGSASRFSNG